VQRRATADAAIMSAPACGKAAGPDVYERHRAVRQSSRYYMLLFHRADAELCKATHCWCRCPTSRTDGLRTAIPRGHEAASSCVYGAYASILETRNESASASSIQSHQRCETSGGGVASDARATRRDTAPWLC